MDVPVSEGDNVVSNGDTSIRGGPLPPPSPLTGCYLLIVVGEPYSEEHKEIILQRIAKGLLSWDMENCHVDLEKELQAITDVAPEGEEARHGERLIQFATENLVTEVLIHPAANTLIQCMKNLLSSFTRHRHIIHSGYTFGGNGSWALQDGTFSLADFTEAFQENDVQRVIKAYENTITIDIHCSSEGDWTRLPKESYTKTCKVQVNPNDVLTSGSSSINGFLNYLSPFLLPADIESLLESSDVVGNIRFSHPTLYVFPGGQGDAALFGINGFNMLVDGGYARKACFWDFTRHLDRLDAVLVTRLNNSNVCGVSSVLKRKTNNQVYPQIGHFFCNLQERKAISPDGDKDRDPLLINLLDEGQDIISNLRQLNLRPQLCYRDTDPINLYHKVGHGTLDMYVLSPAKDSKEVKEFLHKWNTNDQRLFTTRKDPKEFSFPLSNLVSICALLVWKPANPSDTITRLLFPGSTPQHKIFEGLDRLKHLEFMKHPVCSAKSLTPSGSILGLTKSKQTKTTTVLDKILPSEQRTQKILDMKPLKERTPPQSENKQKVENKNENKKLIEMNGTASEENKISKTEKVIKSNSVESDKSEPGSDTKKTELMNGKDVEIILEDKSDPKPKTKVAESKPRQRISSKARSESSTRRSIEKKPKVERKVETKPSPPTPKKTVDAKVNGVAKEKDVPKPKLLNRIGLKSSPTSTPAKSTKDATNRKVVESKYRPAPKKEPIAKKEPAKVYERKPISRRPKAASPVRASKTPASPSKKLPGVKTDKNGVSRTIKLDKEGTTDSSAVSTPSADQDTSKKIDESKLTKTELEELKAKELADLKEEQEVVKEIEAVFRKDEKLNESDQPDLRKIKDVSIEEKTTEADDEEEEYLIVEKEEVEQNTDSVNEQESATKEDEIQKHQRDSEESEKPRKGSDAEKSEEKVPIVEEVPAKIEPEIQETKLIEAETCKVLEIVQPPVKEVEEIIIPTAEMTRSKEDSREKTEEMSKEISVTSPEDKIDISSEKKLTDTRGDVEEEENKEEKDQNYVLESQPDEKFSATIESGATTAPTLPEDERITLDEIKEDQVIEEKYVKEETKEEKEIPAVVITQKPLEAITKISPTVGIIFQAHQSHIRDIVKTPDEVADLPVHEEVDIDTYDFPSAFKKDNKKFEPPAQKEQDESAKPVDKNEVKIDAVKVETDEIVIDEIKTAVEEKPEIQTQEVLHKEDEKDREAVINDVTTDTKVAVVIEQPSEKTEEVLQEAQLEIKEIETIDIKVEKEPQETKQDPIKTVTSVEETKATEEDIKLESTEIKGEVDEKDQAINVAEDKTTKLKEIEQDTRGEVSQQVEAEEDGTKVEKDGIEEVKEENIDISIPTEIKEEVGEIMTTIKDAIAEITSTSIKTEDVLGELKKGESEAATVAATDELDSAEKIDNSEEIINETISEVLEENVLKTEDQQECSDKNAVICDAKEIVIGIIEKAERKTPVVEVIVIGHPYTEAPDANFDTEPRIIEPKTINIEVFSHPYKEDEIVKIVSSVAHVLKSDAPLEELAATLPMEYGSPFKSFDLKGYTTELRETHITTLDSPVQEDAALPGKETYREDFTVCPKQSSVEFIDEEKKIAIEDSTISETQEKDISPQEKKISDLIKDSNALIASTSKIISEIKSAPVVDCVITEEEHETEEITEMSDKHEEAKELSGTSEEAKELSDKPEEDSNDIEALDVTDDTLTKTTGTVHRMLVTASSEDGGEETVICPTGSITFTKEDSGKSSPEKTLSTKSTPREGLSARSTPEPTEKESIVDSKDEAQIQESKNEETIVRKDSTVEETSKEQEVSEKRDDKIEKDTKETETKTKEEDNTEDIVSSGRSSPKLSDHKTSFSDKNTPDIKIAEQTSDKIDAKQEEDIKFEEKISRDDHETENTDKDMIEKYIKAGIDDSKASDETGNAEISNMKIDVIQEKQLITDRASPDIKDEISDTSTKEDVETVKELSPMTTEHVELKQDEKEIIKKDSGKTEPDEIEECIVSKETATITKTSADPSSMSVELDKEEDESAKIEPERQGEIESSKLKADVKEDVEQVEDLIYTIEKEIKSDETKTDTEIKDEIVDSEKQGDVDLKEEKEISEKIQNELEEQKKQTDAEVKIDTITKQKTDDIYEEKESTETLSEIKAHDVTDVTEVAEGLKDTFDTSTAPNENEVQTGKSTPDLKEKSGKSTPESKVDTKESSGKATPDLKQDSLSASAFPASTSESAVTLDKPIPDLKSELKEVVSSIEKSGKSSPDLLISRTSTPDIKADLTSTELSSLTVETKERPGKSTPELNEDGKDTPEILADNGLKVEEKHGSGKSTPELKTTKEDTGISYSVHLSEIKTEDSQSSSGKSSPKPESDTKEQVHQPEVSPEIKDGNVEISKIESLETGAEEIIEEVTEVVSIEETSGTKEQKQSSGKASPAFESQDKDSESKESISETTLQEQEQLDPHENNIGDGDSGKSSPDLKCDRSKSIFSVTSEKSGKSTPNIKEDHITPIATPEIHDIKDVSEKSTPDIKLAERKSIISITSEQSGKSTPDLKPDDIPSGLTLDVLENKDLSGRSTPEIKIDLSCDQSGKSSPDLQEHISDIQDIIADVAPDMKPGDRKSTASITSEHSGKSTPDLKAEHTSPISSPNIHDIKAGSGKSTPDIKPVERKSIISLTSEQSGKSTPRDHVSPRSTPDIYDTKAESDIATTEKSGPSTPEVKASASEVHDTKPESRKSTPDIKNEIEQSLPSETTEKSGKSTPDITATTPEVNDIKNKSGKSTPDIKQDIRKSLSSETTEKSGKSTPDIVATTPEVNDIKHESGKSTPDIKQDIGKGLTLEITEKSGKATPDNTATTPEVRDIKNESGKSTPDIKDEIRKSLTLETNEKSGKSTPDITTTTHEVHDIKSESGKSTPDIKDEIRKSLTSEINEKSGKSTPDITATTHEVHDIKSESGTSTPDIKDEIRKSLTSETSEKSGKSTPDIKATTPEVHDIINESGISTPDIKNEIRKSITSEQIEKSDKSTPDITATTHEVHDIKSESGKSSPDINDEIRKSLTSETTEKSGKSTPDIKATTPEVHDIKNESGKSTPDIKHEIRKSLTSETAEKSGKSTPDMTATTPEVCDIKDESRKSTPDIKTELSKSGVSVTSEQSGTSTPDIRATTSEIHDIKSESEKSTPDIKSETRMSIASVSSEKSGKSTPDIKDTAPDIHDNKSESEKVSPDIKCDVSETVTSVTSEKSGKSTPDIKGTTPEVHDVISESAKFTPDIKCETSNVVSVTSDKSENSIPDIKATTLDVNDIKINSGKSTPDLTEEVDKSVISITSQPSGKSTLEIKATTPDILDTKRESGKTTPDVKCEITESVALVTSGKSTPEIKASTPDILDTKGESGKTTPDVKSEITESGALVTSGKSTPEIKATTPDILDTKGESGKTTPDVKSEITESGALVTSGKSTPEIKATSLDIKLESGKSTPDVKCDINETAFVTSETSGKSTPDIKSPKPEICDVIDDSGKATPDIKCDVSETAVSVTNAKSGKSTPDIKEPTSHEIKSESRNSTPDIKQEIVENITSLTNEQSGKLTPDLKGASGKSTPDINCEIRKSIISITSDISGKSTPDFKDNDVSAHETLDKSGKSTPDLKCEVNTIVASVTSDQSGKSTPEPVRSTPDIYDVYGKSTPDEKCGMRKTMVSITSDQSGKSTPDLKNNTTSAEVHDLDQSGISTPNMETEEQQSIVSINSKQPDMYTPDLKDESESATPELPISNDIKELSEKSTSDVQKNDLTKLETTVVINVKTDLKIIVPTEKDIKESQPNVITTELSVAGPSNLLREDSISSSGQISPSNKDIIHLSSEELHLSGKSTPDIADVERMKEIHEILKHEKHIPGSSTPPTVPVSPIVKETFTLQTEEQKLTEKKELSSVEEKEQVDEKETDTTSITEITETVKQSGITTTSTSTTVTKKVVDDLQLIKDTTEVAPTTKDGSSEIAQKSTDLRCSTPGSDDCDFGGVSSPHSDISSGQMSRVAHAWGHGSSEERQAYSDDDDDVPGSPTSVTSQMTHSPSARYTEFEVGSEKSTKIDPMISSFYGALPDDSAEESSVTSSESKVQSQPIPITTKSHLEYSTTKETEKRFLEDTDLDFEKAMLEHRQTRGTDLISGSASDSPNYKYEITQAKYSKVIKETSMENGKDGIPMKEIAKNGFDKDSEIEQKIKTDSPKKSSPEIMTSSFIEASSSNSQQQDIKKDPIETWGKPLGLPSPALPPTSDMSNKTTPKKMPPSATLAAKNKINDERKRSESPSKYKKNKNNSPVYLDLTYVPHHGNSYYSFVEFFKRVRARYYVFSGTEPSRDVYNALLEAKQTWEDKELEVTIIPTYDTDVLGYWVAENEDLLAKYKIDLSPSASRCTINLQDHETSCSAYRLEF